MKVAIADVETLPGEGNDEVVPRTLESTLLFAGVGLGGKKTVTVAVGEEGEEEGVVGGLDVDVAGVLVVVGAGNIIVVVDREERVDVAKALVVPNGITANEGFVVVVTEGVLVGIVVLVTDAWVGLGIGVSSAIFPEDMAALTEEVQASMDESIPKDTELDVYAPWAESVQYQVNGMSVDQYEYEMGMLFLSQMNVASLPYG